MDQKIITSFHETKKVQGSEGITTYIMKPSNMIDVQLNDTYLRISIFQNICTNLELPIWNNMFLDMYYFIVHHFVGGLKNVICIFVLKPPFTYILTSTKILGTVQCRCACSNRGASSIVRLGQFLDCWVGWPRKLLQSSNLRTLG